jgi:hypothetical protein
MWHDLLTNSFLVTSIIGVALIIVQYFFDKINEQKKETILFWTRQIILAVQKIYPDKVARKKVAVDFLIAKFKMNKEIAEIWVEAILAELESEFGLDLWKELSPKINSTNSIGYNTGNPLIPPYAKT